LDLNKINDENNNIYYAENHFFLELKYIFSKISELNQIPIFLYSIEISNKEISKINLNKIIKYKNFFENYIKKKYNIINFKTAIELDVLEINNFTSNFICDLKDKFDLLIGIGGLNKINRFFIEQTKIDILKNPQNDEKKQKIDFLHHLNSGMNHILFKLAKEKNISILISLNFLELYNNYKVSKEIGRINQNLLFSRKYQIKTKFCFEIKTQYQIKTKTEENFILSLFNLSTIQKKESIYFFENIIKEKEKTNNNNFICDGIKVSN
jgi:RNase P/RNase MRP subunit p30